MKQYRNLQDYFREYLSAEYEKRKQSRPKYSLRSFANFLQVNPGNLSQFFKERRGFSLETIELILKRIEKSPETRKEFLKKYNQQFIKDIKRQKEIRVRTYEKLSEKTFSHISDPIYLVFLNLIKLSQYSSSAIKICRRLGISERKLDRMTKELLRLNLIDITSDGKFVRTSKGLTTSDDVPSLALQAHYKKIFSYATYALEHSPIENRDITGITLPVNTKKIAKAKEIIRNFQDELISLLSDDTADDIYHINISLFPACQVVDS